jgi:cobalt transporter subunit CbtA
MIIRIFIAAILAGIVAGIFYTGAQAVKVVPIIIEAETYESGGETLENHSHSTVAKGQTAHEHNKDAWAPQDGFERIFYSLISNVLVGVAYSLLLAAAIVLSKMPVSPKAGIAWGAAGFVVFVLAPGLGLPPEVPGTVAASVPDRQAWWLATVVLTAGGLALFAFKTQWYMMALGLVLIVASHVYGAPEPVHHASLAPANLAVEFVVAAIVTSGLFWLVLGGVLGWLLPKALANQPEGN